MKTFDPGAKDHFVPSKGIRTPIRTRHALFATIDLHRQFQDQKHHLKSHLPDALRNIIPPEYHSFFHPYLRRIASYWQLGLHLICDNLYQLTNRTLTAAERQSILLLSIYAPIFDDLFDDRLLDEQQIERLITDPDAYVPSSNIDYLAKEICSALLRLAPRKSQFIQLHHNLFHWQKESLKQSDPDIPPDQLKQITYNKSYYAVLLYCSLLNDYPDRRLCQLLYPISGLMQLTNDAFDVWDDLHKNIFTLMNRPHDFDEIQKLFMAEVARTNNLLWRLSYPATAKRFFAIRIHTLHAAGWVAFAQLKKTTAGISTIPDLAALPRKALICDLDTWQQKIACLRQIIRLSNY